jgi:hypothetical protein
MTIIEVERRGLVAIGEDDDHARYESADRLRATRPASASSQHHASVRALVEVQRRFGGLAPRALLGGQFVPGPGSETVIEVCVSGASVLDSEDEPTCPSRLWNQPFVLGLPPEFAKPVLDELADHDGLGFPAGVLTVDRAGFDVVNSSEPIFAQAAGVLHAVLAANLHDHDAEEGVRALVSTW